MIKDLNRIARDTNKFLNSYIKKQSKTELIKSMKYGLLPGGKKIRSKILADVGNFYSLNDGLLLDLLNGSIHEMVLVGDTDHDYEVATNLGIDCILIAHGHQSWARLSNLNAAVLEGLDQLLE